MVKLAVFRSWASLQVASREQHYLKDILKPHVARLTSLWLASLREYARLKFEPEVSSNNAFAGGLDNMYSNMTRKTILKVISSCPQSQDSADLGQFYEASWLQLVEAIASLIDEDSDSVFDALDGKGHPPNANGVSGKGHEMWYRNEPVAFFFVLFGISFEALVRSTSQSNGSHQRMLDILQAMKKIVSTSVAGLAIYQDHIFSEFMELMDRLAMTEGVEVQMVIVEIARNLCAVHPSARKAQAYVRLPLTSVFQGSQEIGSPTETTISLMISISSSSSPASSFSLSPATSRIFQPTSLSEMCFPTTP